MELDYTDPDRTIQSIWKGVPNDIDAAFQFKDQRTYFFKGKGFWRFNDNSMKIAHERPRSNAEVWMKCPRTRKDEDQEEFYGDRSASRRSKIVSATSSAFGLKSSVIVVLAIQLLSYTYM